VRSAVPYCEFCRRDLTDGRTDRGVGPIDVERRRRCAAPPLPKSSDERWDSVTRRDHCGVVARCAGPAAGPTGPGEMTYSAAAARVGYRACGRPRPASTNVYRVAARVTSETHGFCHQSTNTDSRSIAAAECRSESHPFRYYLYNCDAFCNDNIVRMRPLELIPMVSFYIKGLRPVVQRFNSVVLPNSFFSLKIVQI